MLCTIHGHLQSRNVMINAHCDHLNGQIWSVYRPYVLENAFKATINGASGCFFEGVSKVIT